MGAGGRRFKSSRPDQYNQDVRPHIPTRKIHYWTIYWTKRNIHQTFTQRAEEKPCLRTELLDGTYRVSILSRVTLADRRDIDLWSAGAALALKALTIMLTGRLPLSPR